MSGYLVLFRGDFALSGATDREPEGFWGAARFKEGRALMAIVVLV